MLNQEPSISNISYGEEFEEEYRDFDEFEENIDKTKKSK